ncbi:MAG TPA: HAMP domain-containing sensor histidine kinase [Candidatus Acidoferrales bacterium]|nr:HAMP domain-containing sensor histidine kinase [Candidatus Acidoferrales bacterium]
MIAAATARRSVWLPAAAVVAPYLALSLIVAASDTGSAATLPLALGVMLLSLGALLRPFEPAPGEKFSLAASLAFFAAQVLPAGQAIGAIALAETAARVARRTSRVSAAVNVSKAAGAAAGACAVLTTLRAAGVGAYDPRGPALGGLVYLLLTLVPIAAMIGWSSGEGAARAFLAREILPTATLVAIGALAAAIWLASPPLIVLIVPPLAMVEIAGRASARTRVAQTELARSLETQRAFVSDAAHELRNPLAAIRGNLAFVEGAGLSVQEKAALDDARADLARLAVLVDRLLLLSRSDDGPSGAPSTDLSAIARRVADTVARRPDVALAVVASDVAPVAMPAELVEALVRDVVANAAAYTERGTIGVSVSTSRELVTLEVRDTGVGIADEDLPRVFDRFFRGPTARDLAPGSGLGLAIVRRIAESYGGSVSLESRAGEGTTVRVLLPLAPISA